MVKKDISYYLENPTDLLQKKPFTRGGAFVDYRAYEADIDLGSKVKAELPNSRAHTVSQEVYMQEYDPSRHDVHKMMNLPVITATDGSQETKRIVVASSLQKIIHNSQVLHLTANKMDFVLCEPEISETTSALFSKMKQEWFLRNMEMYKTEAVSRQKSTGDVCLLFYMSEGKLKLRVYSYRDGYTIIPNYNEFGEQIATSIYYDVDGIQIIDTYDNKSFYRHVNEADANGEKQWKLLETKTHGFPINPAIYHRGYVAWEFSQALIELREVLMNVLATNQSRYALFALYIKGAIDEEMLKSRGNTMILNDADPETKGDAKVLEFPTAQGMIEYIDSILNEISLSSSVSFLSPNNIKMGSDSKGGAMTILLKNDIALAKQSVTDWSLFADDMCTLFKAGLDMEMNNGAAIFMKLRVKASFTVWTPESMDTIITNEVNKYREGLQSLETTVGNLPNVAPDEMERLASEKEKAQKETQITKEVKDGTDNGSSDQTGV